MWREQKPESAELGYVLYRDRTAGWEPVSRPRLAPGSYEEKAYVHSKHYPQHPLCIRRVYWALSANAEEREDGERYILLSLSRIEPGTEKREKLYEVEVEKVADEEGERYEMVKSRGVLNPEAYDIFDPVDQAMGQDWMDEVYQVRGEREALLIQEQLLMDEDEDWRELYETHFGAREVMRPRCRAMEVVQVLRRDDEEAEYKTFPRYSSY